MEIIELSPKLVPFLSPSLSEHISVYLNFGHSGSIRLDNNKISKIYDYNNIRKIEFHSMTGNGYRNGMISYFEIKNDALYLCHYQTPFVIKLSKDQWLNHHLFGRKVVTDTSYLHLVKSFVTDNYTFDGLLNRMIYDSIDILLELGKDISLFSVLDFIGFCLDDTYDFESRYSKIFSYWSILYHFRDYLNEQA